MRRFAALMAVILVSTPCAQEARQDNPEKRLIAGRVGTWELVMKVGETESKGTITYQMERDGRWVTGVLESEIGGEKFIGKSTDSYHPVKKKYVSVWVDNLTTAPMIMQGTYDPRTKTLTLTGEAPGVDRKPTKYKSVSKFPDDDTEEMSMYIGDSKEPSFTIKYKRKK